MTDDLQRLAESINELTRPQTHTERFQRLEGHVTLPDGRTHGGSHVRKLYKVTAPSLIEQLEQAGTPGQTGDQGARSVPNSRPSARLEALDILMRIDQAANGWLRILNASSRNSTSDNLQQLTAYTHRLNPEQLADLRADAYGWVVWARITTGWEVPPWRPNNTCPLCDQRGGLRVRVGDGVSTDEIHAMCANCGEHWDNTTIALLADHIRHENADDTDELGASA